MKKIAIIGLWYGEKLPEYFNLWLLSCRYNKTIDFFVITNILIKEHLPDNVTIINLKFDDLKLLFERKLGFEISLNKPYKLCDFRPIYGDVFEDILKKYDYWGHCDFDIIWGNIREFLEKYNIDKYDVFLNRGHLTLYKNVQKINKLYMLKGDKCDGYKNVYKSKMNWGFDETNGMNKIIEENNIKCFTKVLAADIDVRKKRYTHVEIENNIQTKNYEHQVFYFDKGRIFMAFIDKNGKIKINEYIYIHLQKRKNLEIDINNIDNSFWITNKGFYRKVCNKIIQHGDFITYNKFLGKEVEIEEIKKYNKKHWRLKIRKILYKFKFGRKIISKYYFIKTNIFKEN